MTTAATPPQSFPSPTKAIEALVAAWQAQDRPAAARVASAAEVDALFAVDPGGFALYGCDTGEFPTSRCNYRNRSSGGYVAITAKRSDATTPPAWQVSGIVVS